MFQFALGDVTKLDCVVSACTAHVQAKHAAEGCVSWGVNGETGDIADMKDYGVWEAYSVKAQTYKTAIEVHICHCCLLLISRGTGIC